MTTIEELKELVPNVPNEVLADYASCLASCYEDYIPNESFWLQVDTAFKAAQTIVPKKWGFESIVVNNDLYCLKMLVFWRGGFLGRHFHKLKSESFLCVEGELGLTINKTKCMLQIGDKVDIRPGMVHSLEAFEYSVVIEVSTKDRVEDSFRELPNSSYNYNNWENLKSYL